MEYIDVVNDKDKVIGKVTYDEIYAKKPLHRIIHVLIFDHKGKLLLQKRSKAKSYLPQYWCTSAGGHIQSGESYKQGAVRETLEELGIKPKLQKFRKYTYTDNQRGITRFLGVFSAIHSGKISNTAEVEETKYFTFAQIQKLIKSGEKFHPELLFLLKKEFNISVEQPRVVKKSQTWIKQISPKQRLTEYNNGEFETVDIARFENNGSKNKNDSEYSLNTKCTMLFYILDGKLEMQTDTQTYEVAKEDVFILPKCTKYKFKGVFTALVISSPAWFPEQYKVIL